MTFEPFRPLVAVVTPVYNGARNLRTTMECVQAQTYANLVHVVVDNASTDGTAQIIESFQKTKVPVQASRNDALLPIEKNWETAVRKVPAETKYFLVLCHNDLITPDAIEKFVEVAERYPSVGVVGCLWHFGPDPNRRDHLRAQGLPPDRNFFDGHWALKSFLQQCHHSTSPNQQLFRRSLLDERKPFYSQVNQYNDIEACVATLVDHDYGFVHSPLGFSRCGDGGISDSPTAGAEYIKAWLNLIETYGPAVMSKADLEETRRAFLHHYHRRLLLWRLMGRDKSLYIEHRDWLASKGLEPSLTDYAISLVEWAKEIVFNKRQLVGRSKALCDRTWSELSSEGAAPRASKIESLELKSA